MGTFAYHADNPKMSAITGNTVISGGRRSNQPFFCSFGLTKRFVYRSIYD